jgi:hypothetical protein
MADEIERKYLYDERMAICMAEGVTERRAREIAEAQLEDQRDLFK